MADISTAKAAHLTRLLIKAKGGQWPESGPLSLDHVAEMLIKL